MASDGKRDSVKQLALTALFVVAIFWGYRAVTNLLEASAARDAQKVAERSLPFDGLRYGRFNDFGHGVFCLEFTSIPGRKTERYGAVLITGEDEAESRQAVRAVLPSYEECLIKGAG